MNFQKILLPLVILYSIGSAVFARELSHALNAVYEEFSFVHKLDEKTKNILFIISYIKQKVLLKREEIINLLAQGFKEQGDDLNSLLIDPMLNEIKNDSCLKEVIFLIAEAMQKSLIFVHPDSLCTLFEYCSQPQKKEIALLLANEATCNIVNVAPRLIRLLAETDPQAALLLAQAALVHSDQIKKSCEHLIPFLAQLNDDTKIILNSVSRDCNILDKFLFTEHSGRAAVCNDCRGFCRFSNDNDIENIAKLIKGVRYMCDMRSTNWSSEWVFARMNPETLSNLKELLALPEAQNIYCTTNACFLIQNELQAKLHQLYLEGLGDDSLHSAKHNEFLFGKILGYQEEDIEFYYIRCARICGKSVDLAKAEFSRDKELAEGWLQEAPKKLDQIKDWSPKKLVDVIFGVGDWSKIVCTI